MLIDLDFDQRNIADPVRFAEKFKVEQTEGGIIVSYIEDDGTPSVFSGAERIERGIYYTGYNFHMDIEMFTKWKEERYYGTDEQTLREKMDDIRNGFNTYGVCDTVEQWKERFGKAYDEHPMPCVVHFSPIVKANQPAEGGWRWHKWGEYIGTQEPTCEYIYDEEHIDEVLVFGVCFLEEKTDGD